MRSFDLTAKIRKDRSPVSRRSPIAPSGFTCLGAGSGVDCSEAPAITSFSPPCPSPPEEQAEPNTNTTSSATTNFSILFTRPRVTTKAALLIRPPHPLIATNCANPRAPPLLHFILGQQDSSGSRSRPRRIVLAPLSLRAATSVSDADPSSAQAYCLQHPKRD